MAKRPLHPPLDELLQNPFVRLRLAVLLLALLLAFGTGGYVFIERYTALQALYMTVITLSTVGYGEVRPLDNRGEIFTIILILGGIGTAAWVFTTVIEVFVSEQTLKIIGRRRMDRRVDAMTDHFIICGYGRIGQQIAQMYGQERVPFLVVEQEPSRLTMLREANYAHVEGDAADDDALIRAGIERARALIAVTPTDAINTFIVLSAHGLCPKLHIIARADSLQNEAKLYRAGASKVVSPHNLGGRWMGVTAINPAVTEFVEAMTDLDHSQFMLHEFTVLRDTTFQGQTFGQAALRTATGALVVAIKQREQQHQFVPNPPDSAILVTGDVLIAIGSMAQLNALAKLIKPDNPEKIVAHGLTRA